MSDFKFKIGDEVEILHETSPVYGGRKGVIKSIDWIVTVHTLIYMVKFDDENYPVSFWQNELQHIYSFYKLETLIAMGDYYGCYPSKKHWENNFPMSANTIRTLFGSVILDQLLANRANKNENS